jgi:ornithine cyclodeaminase/alanine dehydrogenase-like protein (mu-crystallin family)
LVPSGKVASTWISLIISGGTRAGRTDADQLTVYKSVGVAVMDAAAAALVLRAAADRGAGIEVEL